MLAQTSLTAALTRAYNAPAAPYWAAGFGRPEQRRTSRQQCGYFYVRQHSAQFGRSVQDGASHAGSFARSSNLHNAALLHLEVSESGLPKLQRSLAMSNLKLNPSVKLVNGQATTTSLKIAEAFGKRHDAVLRAITNLECSEEFRLRNFVEASYEVKQPKGGSASYKMYTITRDGFAFLASGFTGKEAAQWKEKYIAAFNALEKAALEKAAAKKSLPSGRRVKAAALPTASLALPEFSDELQKAISHRTQSLMLEGYDRTRESIKLRVRGWQESGWSNERILTELEKVGSCIGDLHLIQSDDLYNVTSMLSILRVVTEGAMKGIHHLEVQTGRKWYGRSA